jgi:methanogenic corrinoid protein MtbC1
LTQLVDRFEQALLTVDRLEARKIFNELRKHKTGTPIQCIERLVIPVLERIGEGWEHGRVALSQVYMSGRICEELVDTVLPPGDPAIKGQQKIAIAVLEDYHLLGKRIIYSALRASGFEVRDYGRMEVDELSRRARDDRIRVLLVSTLMLPSALRVKKLRVRLKELAPGAKNHVKIVVGGAPFRFDDQLWREVGADAAGNTAFDAVNIIARLTGGTA